MKRRHLAPIFWILTIPSAIPLAAWDPSGGGITVRLYNFAGTPAPEVVRAQQEASDIFARSDIRLKWLNCTLNTDGNPADAACHVARVPAVLNLRLAPQQMEPKHGLPKGICGFSLISTSGDFSSTAIIYLERVTEITDGRKYRRGVVLGAMIAHELGHLLLGVGSHSKMGLMSLPWGPKLLTAADQGTLGFTKRETRKLGKAVQERLQASSLAEKPDGEVAMILGSIPSIRQ